MGRKRADVWNEYEEIDKEGSFKARRVRCIHCGHEFTAHANRMKDHLRECQPYQMALFKGAAHPIDLSSAHYDLGRHHSFERVVNPPLFTEGTSRIIYRMGIVGGSGNAIMGPHHINGALLTRRVHLVCGCFSSDPSRSKITGLSYGLNRNRIYKTYEQMILHEAELPESERMHFVTIATPTNLHFPIAMLALENGFHVMCESPLCFTEDEANKLYRKAGEKGLVLAVSTPHCFYGMIKYARDIISSNCIGDVLSVRISYLQNRGKVGKDLNSWKLNSPQCGISYCFSDLGLQCFHLFRFLTQLHPVRVSACFSRSSDSHALDDSGYALLQTKDNVFCMLNTSKVALLHDNEITAEIDGVAGSIRWSSETPSNLLYQRLHMNRQVLTAESQPLVEHLRGNYCRNPGFQESFTDAVANMYDTFLASLDWRGRNEMLESGGFVNLRDGLEGVSFLSRAMESTQKGSTWSEMMTPGLVEAGIPQGNAGGFGAMPVGNYPVLNPVPPLNDMRGLGMNIMQPIVQDEATMMQEHTAV